MASLSQIAAGDNHSVGLRLDGTVECWGANDEGQTDAPAGRFVAIAAGYGHSLALRPDGVVLGWGDNFDGQADTIQGAKKFPLPVATAQAGQ